MFDSVRYDKDGLAHGLIEVHDALLKDIIEYFEKGKEVRKATKEARSAIKRALRLTRKKKIDMLEPIEKAREAMRDLHKELEYTRKALVATSINMDNALRLIEEERIEKPVALIERACELFRRKNYVKAKELLEKAQKEIEKKGLDKTRTAMYGGLTSEVKDLKEEIAAVRQKIVR
jgi:tetratricopeptide (TPR) repeat protein